jgi:hypothetical protein
MTKLLDINNTPNVVTEILPHAEFGMVVYTRRMRGPGDPEPVYIKSWEDWNRVCVGYAVCRQESLSEGQMALMRLGLPGDGKGEVCGMFLSSFFPRPEDDDGNIVLKR